MAIKVKAVERKLKFTKNENDPGVYRYVLGADYHQPPRWYQSVWPSPPLSSGCGA